MRAPTSACLASLCIALAACGGQTVASQPHGAADGGPTDHDSGRFDVSSPVEPEASSDSGSVLTDAQPPVVVKAAADASCTPGVSSASNQPDNPCAAGYIWGCNNSDSTWVEETITCFTGPSETTPTTEACPPGEVLYVDDAAGDPCMGVGGTGTGTGTAGCGDGGYYFEPGCCYHRTDAYCVQIPTRCAGDVTCDCASSICPAQCNGGTTQGDVGGISCQTAGDGVVDCLCGKA